MLHGEQEWLTVPAKLRHCLKIEYAATKFYQCPISSITPYSWQLLQLVNDTITADGDLQPLCPGHPALAEIAARPQAWREAVRIVKAERAAYRQHTTEKPRNGK